VAVTGWQTIGFDEAGRGWWWLFWYGLLLKVVCAVGFVHMIDWGSYWGSILMKGD